MHLAESKRVVVILPQLILGVFKAELTEPGVAPACTVRTVSGLVAPETVNVDVLPAPFKDTPFVLVGESFITTEETVISEVPVKADIVRFVSSVESDWIWAK